MVVLNRGSAGEDFWMVVVSKGVFLGVRVFWVAVSAKECGYLESNFSVAGKDDWAILGAVSNRGVKIFWAGGDIWVAVPGRW